MQRVARSAARPSRDQPLRRRDAGHHRVDLVQPGPVLADSEPRRSCSRKWRSSTSCFSASMAWCSTAAAVPASSTAPIRPVGSATVPPTAEPARAAAIAAATRAQHHRGNVRAQSGLRRVQVSTTTTATGSGRGQRVTAAEDLDEHDRCRALAPVESEHSWIARGTPPSGRPTRSRVPTGPTASTRNARRSAPVCLTSGRGGSRRTSPQRHGSPGQGSQRQEQGERATGCARWRRAGRGPTGGRRRRGPRCRRAGCGRRRRSTGTSPSGTSASVASSGPSMRTRTRAVPLQPHRPKGIVRLHRIPHRLRDVPKLRRAHAPGNPRDDAWAL